MIIKEKKIFIEYYFSENKPARSHLNILVAHNDDPTNTLVVRFADQEKLGVKDIKEYSIKMVEENIISSIIVVQNGVTHIARDANYLFEIFPSPKK